MRIPVWGISIAELTNRSTSPVTTTMFARIRQANSMTPSCERAIWAVALIDATTASTSAGGSPAFSRPEILASIRLSSLPVRARPAAAARRNLMPPAAFDGSETFAATAPRTSRPGRLAQELVVFQIRSSGAAPGYCRITISFLISAIALAGFRPFGQVLVQFMMVWQRYSRNGSSSASSRSPVYSSRLSAIQR